MAPTQCPPMGYATCNLVDSQNQPSSLKHLLKRPQARYLYLNYLAEFNKQHELDDQRMQHRFTRLCITLIGGYLIGLDLLSVDRKQLKANIEAKLKTCGRCFFTRLWARKLPDSDWRQRLRFGWVSHVVLVVYLGFSLHLMLIIYRFYSSDFARLRLDKLRDWISIYGPDRPIPRHLATNGHNLREQPMRELETELAEQSAQLDNLLVIKGNISNEFGMLVECGCLYLLAMAFYLFYIPRIAYNWMTPLDVHIIRNVIDYKGEQQRIEWMCQQEVERFLDSSRAYDRNKRAVCPVHGSMSLGTFQMSDGHRAVGQPASASLVDNKRGLINSGDTKACRLLVKMMEQGALAPPNTSKAWIERRINIQFVLHCVLLVYLLIIDIFGILYFRIPMQRLIPVMTLAQILAEFSMYGTIFIVAAAASFMLPLLLVSCWEQMRMVQRLIQLVDECISLNQLEFQDYQAIASELIACRNKCDQHWYRAQLVYMADRMNSNYLFVLLSFRIFLVQLQAFKRTCQLYIPVAMIITLLLPIFILIHAPYLNLDGHKLRWLAFAFSIAILIASNCLLLPLCHSHSQCSKIYTSLSSLIAHIISVELEQPQLYDQYSVALLKKELLNSESFLDQFVMREFGISATYSTWVRFHFWWGIVALSMVVDSKNRTYGSFLQDPLRVYTF